MPIPVILSGGSGNRLWPLSRESYPKQFLNLIGANSLLQNIALRAHQITENAPIIICNQNHRFMAADHDMTEIRSWADAVGTAEDIARSGKLMLLEWLLRDLKQDVE
jgi:mannose-1-phosphate guanylyltransferase